MHYLIDGYNLLFFCRTGERRSLEAERKALVAWLQQAFARMKCKATLVFDGAHTKGEESGRAYPSPLEVVYAPKGQSADAYIVEMLETAKNPKIFVTVTNDRGLHRHARSFGAKVESNGDFLARLKKQKEGTKQRRLVTETPSEIARLTQIFEKRFLDEL